MKKHFAALLLILTLCFNSQAQKSSLKDGDIVFQSNTSLTAQAIRIATHSDWNHCGIVFIEEGKPYVYEAVQPIRKIPLDEWAAQGTGGKYAVKRLKSPGTKLNAQAIEAMKAATVKHLGKNYDLYFGWDDNRIYCSELVWKAYQRGANLQVGTPKKLRDFDLSHPLVQKKLRERYGDKIPMDETVISPEDIFASPLLETVKN